MKNNFFTRDVVEALSPLESEIINIMNFNDNYNVRDIYNLIKKRKRVAKSSISVILDRLYEKGLVDRKTENARGGIRFVYFLEKNRENFEREVVDNTVKLLIKKFGSKAVVYFNESLGKRNKK